MITVHQELDPVQPWMDPEQQPLEQILICDAYGNAPTDSTPSDDPDNTKCCPTAGGPMAPAVVTFSRRGGAQQWVPGRLWQGKMAGRGKQGVC
jgi:hypothetical protein